MTLVAPPKPHPSHRVRTGQHQRRRKHFAKAYWPYLPLLLVVGLGLICNALWPASNNVLGAHSDLSAGSLLAQTNVQRVADHETYLTLSSRLNKAAQTKAEDMVARNYWSHNTPSGQTPWSFITAAGYSYQKAGENLAYGFSSADTAVAAWMNSPTHRANILNGSYRQVGFGLASAKDFNHDGPTTVIVAMYAEPAASSSTATTVVPPAKPLDSRSQPVARVQLLTGGAAPWSVFVLTTVAALALVWLLLRHGRYWHRALAKSEVFVIDHPLLDVTVVAVGVIAVILSQTAGFVH